MKKVGIIGFGWLGSRITDSMSDKYQIYITATKSDKIAALSSKKINITLTSCPDFQLGKKVK